MDKISGIVSQLPKTTDVATFKALYSKFKREVLLPEGVLALSPTAIQDAAINAKVLTITQALEDFALAAIQVKDIEQFTNVVQILQSFYVDFNLLRAETATVKTCNILAYYLSALLLQGIIMKHSNVVTKKRGQTFNTLLMYLQPHDNIMQNPVIQIVLTLQSTYTSGSYNKLFAAIHQHTPTFQAIVPHFDLVLHQLEEVIMNKIAQLLSVTNITSTTQAKHKLSTIVKNYNLLDYNITYLTEKCGVIVDKATDTMIVKRDVSKQKTDMADEEEEDDQENLSAYNNQQFIADLIKIAKNAEKIV